MAYPKINKSRAQSRFNLSKRSAGRRGIKYIVVHYTGTRASAENNCKFFGRANRGSSADYFIDKDGEIWQFNANEEKYYSWHCGDGHGKYGITNANSVGIEVVSAGEEYTDAQKKALNALVTAMMADYGINRNHVVRHYDASRKRCPAPYCGSTAKEKKWNTLKDYITKGQTVAKEVVKHPVQLYQANNTDAQKWQPIHNADGTYCFKNKKTGFYLDVSGGKKDNSTVVQAYKPNGTDAQKWRVVQYTGTYSPAAVAPFEIVPVISEDKRLDVRGGGSANGTVIQIYAANGTGSQKFAIIDDGKGYWEFINTATSKAIDVDAYK